MGRPRNETGKQQGSPLVEDFRKKKLKKKNKNSISLKVTLAS